MNSETRNCQNCKQNFVIDSDDFAFYEKMKVPPPTFCPECRMIRRFVWRNERHLFRRKDDATGMVRPGSPPQEIFSSFPPQVTVKVYNHDYWWSDNWDPSDYGRDYDFSRPFFEQFRELFYSVPLPARSVFDTTNSEYCDNASYVKNSYLSFNVGYLENSAYCVTTFYSKDNLDLYEARHAELSYENYMSDEAYRVFFSVNIEDSTDIWFSRNLMGCNNCFGCVNLRNKSYYIFNKPYSKEDYFAYIKQFDLGSYKTKEELLNRARKFWMQFPMRFTLAINVVNSTGEHIEHSRNLKRCYSIHKGENMAYCQIFEPPGADSYDCTVFGWGASRSYESLVCGEECYDLKFCIECWPSLTNLEYSAHCHSSNNLFGCIGLKKKEYCILNKQYSKEEYFKLREKIIQHMNEMPYIGKIRNQKSEIRNIEYKYGEFFPAELSPFAYNETLANDFFPLTKEEAEAKGFLWREQERREYETTINALDLPDNIKDVQDSILKEIIKCGDCGRAYRIIEMELQFYRRIPLPLPRKCPECRFKDRFKFVNPPKLWKGKCQCAGETSDQRPETSYRNAVKHFHGAEHCPNEFETSYQPNRPEIVYCESCYNSEVA